MTLHKMKGEFCVNCHEGVWDEESYRRYTEAQAGLLRAAKGDLGIDIRTAKAPPSPRPEKPETKGGCTPHLRNCPKAPFAHPYFWAPFIIVGNWK